MKETYADTQRPIDDQQPTNTQAFSIKRILESDNLAIELDQETAETIKKQILSRYNTDLSSRKEKNEELRKILELTKLYDKGRSEPWDKASNVLMPIIATACGIFGDFAYPELITSETVKGVIIGNDDGEPAVNVEGEQIINPETGEVIFQNVGAKQQRANRVTEFMNWQLKYDIEDWEEGTDKLLNAVAALGTLFKKTYWNSASQKVTSEAIFPDKIIIHDRAISLENAVVTQIIDLYRQQIVERIRKGIFIDFSFDKNGDNSEFDDPKSLHLPDHSIVTSDLHGFLEQHMWYDLDKDGYPEPYIGTIHKGTETLCRLVRAFEEEDIKYNDQGKVASIARQQYFTKFIFKPNPDGSFYGLGLGHLLFNINHATNSIINQLIDAGTLSNRGGGFIAKSIKGILPGENKFRMGEWKVVDNFGVDLEKNIVPLPVKEPSQTLFVLLQLLLDTAKSLGMLSEAITGEQAANISPTVAYQNAEQGIKHFRAIFKRLSLSFSEEFKKIFKLNARYLTDEKYLKVIDETIAEASVVHDFRSDDYDLIPNADIENLSSLQRITKINSYLALLQSPIAPFLNGQKIAEDVLRLMKIEDRDKIIITPQPQTDPLVEMERIKQENRTKEVQIEAIKVAADLEEKKYNIKYREAEIENLETKSLLNIANVMAAEKDKLLADREMKIREYEAILEGIHRRTELELQAKDQEIQQQQQAQAQQQQQEIPQEAPMNELEADNNE